jgi:L-fuconolactonase
MSEASPLQPLQPDQPVQIVQPQPRPDWLGRVVEETIEPELAIVDPHHHFSPHWGGYFTQECLDDVASGHRIRATVFVQCGFSYRSSGAPELFPVGETERVVAMADAARAIAPSVALCAGIVGYADLRAGDAVAPVLEAHLQAGEGRFRGLRSAAARHPSFRYGVLAPPPDGLYADPGFRRGFARLAPLGLSFDALCYHPQLDQVVDLARAFPQTTIVLDHLGCPLGVGDFRQRTREVLRDWRRSMASLAGCPNVSVKLGGMGVATSGLEFHCGDSPPSSLALAAALRPYVEACVELFGADRCMFESNFPVDKGMYGYHVLWNAFKRVTSGATAQERRALFHDTAVRCYRLHESPAFAPV